MPTNKRLLNNRQATVSRNCIPTGRGRYTEVPAIRVAGRYLQKRGFTIGSKVTIEEYEGMIVIKLDEKCTDFEGPYPYSTLNKKMNVIREFSEEAIRRNLTYDEKLIHKYFCGELSRDIQSLMYKFSKGLIPKQFHPHVTKLLGEVLKEEIDEATVNEMLKRITDNAPDYEATQSDVKGQDAPPSDLVIDRNPTRTPGSDPHSAELRKNQIDKFIDHPRRA